MELKDYFNVILRRKWTILLTVIITMIAVVIGTQLQTPIYKASTTLRVAVSAGGPQNSAVYTYNEQLMNTYAEIATSRPVMEELTTRLQISEPPLIKAEVLPNTELIVITAEDTDPKLAMTVSNTLADILIVQSSQLYMGGARTSQEILEAQLAQAQLDVEKTRQDYKKLVAQTPAAPNEVEIAGQLFLLKQNNYAALLSQYNQAMFREEIQASMITMVEPAIVPDVPSSPRTVLNYGLGLIVGLLGGLGLAFIFENLDTNLYTTRDIEAATKLGAFANIPNANRKQLIISNNGSSPIAKAFQNFASNICLTNGQKLKKVLLATSAEPGQGTSTVVSNLAYSLSLYGKNVIAIDCNVYSPSLHTLFGLPNEHGLTDVLEKKLDLKKAIQKSSYEGLSILSSGALPAHPSGMLGTPQMDELIRNLSQQFDYIVLDTPAYPSMAGIPALVRNVDGLILVVRRAHAQREAVQSVDRFLSRIQDKFVGLVVNQAEDVNSKYFYQY